MRLGIDYRLLASRENLVNRGIGRYTQHQLREVLALDHENEYLLLCPPGSDVSLVLAEIREAANLSMAFGPPPGAVAGAAPLADPYERSGLLRRSAEYQDWIHGLEVDLYHSTAPFVLEQTAPPAFDACPMVATVYDFIPLIFPREYLKDPGRQAAYAGAARLVTSATRLIAISDGTRDDAAQYLGFPQDSIDCAWPYADACFRPLLDGEVSDALAGLRVRVPLPGRFVLTVAALHHTKNLELLFAAYAMLSPSFRRSLPLVVACHVDEAGAEHIRRWAAGFGVAGDLVITGYVSDAELAALYNRATILVHPSRYEGFGLPVVEAMQCGTAVVTTTAPSLPEVAAGAAVLVDPDDAVGLAAAVEGLSGDETERRRMGEMGVKRAAAYTPEALGRATLASYRATLTTPPRSEGLRVAVCTPCPPAPGDAADHAVDLLRSLPRHLDVEVFTDDADGPLPVEVVDGFPVHHRTALGRCHDRRPFDVVLHNVDGTGRQPDDLEARTAVVAPSEGTSPLGVSDPVSGRPRFESLLARARLGWSGDRFIVGVLDGLGLRALVDAVAGRVEVVPADDDRLLGCDLVVAMGETVAPRPLVVAAAAGKPLIVAGPGWPSTFADRLTGVEEIAARVVELADDARARRRRSAAARAWFEEYAGLDQVSAFYDRLLDLGEAPDAQSHWDGLAEAGDPDSETMAGRALAEFGWRDRDARILVLGIDGADLAFRLTNDVGEVTLAAPWLDRGGTPFSRALLVDPGLVTTVAFDAARLVVRHVDLRRLPFPAEGFDAVLAPRAMDGFGEDGVAQAMTEAARVVNPGGLVVASLGVRLHGPAGSAGIPLHRVLDGILPVTGLEPVDEMRAALSERTRTARRAFSSAVSGFPTPGEPPVSVRHGAVLGRLLLTLRKP